MPAGYILVRAVHHTTVVGIGRSGALSAPQASPATGAPRCSLQPDLTFRFPGKAPWTIPFPAFEPAPAAGADRKRLQVHEASAPLHQPPPATPQKTPKIRPRINR